MEQLIGVEEFFGETLSFEKESYGRVYTDTDSYDGFKIKTTERDIIIAISDSQSCCENFGIISTEDITADFIGANVLDVTITEGNLTEEIEKNLGEYISKDDTEFITLNTSKGSLQFVVYNSHNGYYGHSVYIKIGEEVTSTGI